MAIKSYFENGIKLYEVYVNGCDAGGRRIQRRKNGLDSKRKAEITEFELKREIANLKDGPRSYRWEEWHAECIRRMKLTCRPSTMVAYELQIKKWVHPRWQGIDLDKITRLQVHNFIFEELDAKLTPYTRKTILKMVRRIFQLAVEEGVLDRNPCAGVQVKVPEVEQRVLTAPEVKIFLQEAKATSHRFYPMWALALMTGMRSGELFALKWSDVDLDGRTISVSKQWTSKNGFGPTKTQRSRIVPVSDALAKFLKERKLKCGAGSEFILPQIPEWENGEQARITREFCAAIGITSVKFHDLRATFITNLLARGVSLARVMSIVGHTQIKTTNGYLRKAGVEVQGATEDLGYTLPDESTTGSVIALVRDM